MSGWGLGGWFGGGGGTSATQKKKDSANAKNAILQLRATHEMLSKREKHLQNQMDDQENAAKKYLAQNNKSAAKAALRRKKAHEHNLEQTSAHMLTIEREISSIETANINKETLDAMRNAGRAMKGIHAGLTPEGVDQAMEELRDQHAISEEISDALRSGAIGQDLDEEDLDDELEQLQQEQLDEKMLKSGSVPVDSLPAVSRTEPSTKTRAAKEEEEDEEEELKRLQAEMAM